MILTPPPPWANPHLFGLEDAEALLRRNLARACLHPAWIFVGESGIGKTVLAYRLARFVLHYGVPPRDAPGIGLALEPHHNDFRLVAQQSHPRLLVPDHPSQPAAAANLNVHGGLVIDAIRTIAAFANRTTGPDEWQVCLIDKADVMTPPASHALLKIIEEPPSRVLFILICERLGALPATLRSRCRQLRLRRPNPAALDAFFKTFAEDSEIPHPELQTTYQTIAQIAAGCPGRAMTMLAHDGLDIHDRIAAILDAMPAFDLAELMRFCSHLAAEPARNALARDMLAGRLRMIIRNAANAPPHNQNFPPAARLVGAASLAQWSQAWETLSALFVQADTLFLDRRQTLFRAFMIFHLLTSPTPH